MSIAIPRTSIKDKCSLCARSQHPVALVQAKRAELSGSRLFTTCFFWFGNIGKLKLTLVWRYWDIEVDFFFVWRLFDSRV